LLHRIVASVRSHIGAATQFDDITMIAARRKSVLDGEAEGLTRRS
jgi:serine phosphatase RsbU (regulator of sigma subunit)